MSARGAWHVARILELPEDLADLREQSRSEGYVHVDRLHDDWRSAANRFDADGEALFAARGGSALVGICGLNRDPFAGDESVARLRHLYVSPAWRRRGVGRSLVDAAVRHAGIRFRTVRLRTHDPGASLFYDRLGFHRAPDRTHATDILRFTEERCA